MEKLIKIFAMVLRKTMFYIDIVMGYLIVELFKGIAWNSGDLTKYLTVGTLGYKGVFVIVMLLVTYSALRALNEFMLAKVKKLDEKEAKKSKKKLKANKKLKRRIKRKLLLKLRKEKK